MRKDSVNRTYDSDGMTLGAPLWTFKIGGSASYVHNFGGKDNWRGDEFDEVMRLVYAHCKHQALVGWVKMEDQGKPFCKTIGGG
ncbi:hypothetical protein PG997_015454 [Apiospora hydei]|uniref:Uncharacterized protein n=1 Tax=Apiospora hydei TaxID=1337664 RepID=A0ABR1UTT5_9PEZI